MKLVGEKNYITISTNYQLEVSTCFDKAHMEQSTGSRSSPWNLASVLSILSPLKIHPHPPGVHSSQHPRVAQPIAASTQSSKISSTSYQLKSQISSSEPGMGEVVGMICPGAKFLSISGPAKLENNSSAPKMQGWAREGIPVIGPPVRKGNDGREKGVASAKQF